VLRLDQKLPQVADGDSAIAIGTTAWDMDSGSIAIGNGASTTADAAEAFH
jgi:hypothetical protein